MLSQIQQMRRAGKTFTEADGVDEAFTLKAFLDGTARKRNWFSFPEFFAKVISLTKLKLLTRSPAHPSKHNTRLLARPLTYSLV